MAALVRLAPGALTLPRKASFESAHVKVSITAASSSKLLSCLIKWWSMHLCTVVEWSSRNVRLSIWVLEAGRTAIAISHDH